MDKSITVL